MLNRGDPEPPNVREIGRAVGAAIGHEWEEVLVPESGYELRAASNPWGVPRPLVVDMSAAAEQLGYRPITTYPEAVRETCSWLVAAVSGRDWREVFPRAPSISGANPTTRRRTRS